ncbi:MAG: Tex family protein [Bacteriovoracia bacterium]
MTFETWLKDRNPEIPGAGAAAVLKLAAEGGTVPFIARYRKEQTGNLDEVAIRAVIEGREEWDELVKRQEFIVSEIEKQGKLTPELRARVLETFHRDTLEDIYLPYKVKRKTKATLAREAGLEPLADWIWNCGHGTETPQPGQTLQLWAFTFRNEAAGFKEVEQVIEGAQSIVIERLSENLELRQFVRDEANAKGFFVSTKGDKAKPNSKFENYFNFREPVKSLIQPQNSHRYLAMRRGQEEGELSYTLGGGADDAEFENRLLTRFRQEAIGQPDSPGHEVLERAATLALKAYVFPSIETEINKAVKKVADETAITVFAENVRKLLLASPLGPKAVLGVDPGLRTGCKLAVVDQTGKYLTSTVIYLQSDDAKANAAKLLVEAVKNAGIEAIAVGNGTAGRETELFVRKTLKEAGHEVPVIMVSEAGASVYSASDTAREEFPELDVTVRGAISIARRLQDPLAELVKIDPKSIGVGQYQHDVSQPALARSLEGVVDSCVNGVGVNLNTASYHLLAHVSGIGPGLAKSIVEFRGKKGLFQSRQQLLEVPRFSDKAFEQAAGFLRIPDADNPLDNTGVHPERYGILENFAKKTSRTLGDLLGAGVQALRGADELRQEIGSFTFLDMIRELEKPGRDPREEFTVFQFRDDIHQLSDLKPGLSCPGIVTNVTNFGAFVDIGVHQDGLVHLSQLSNKFIKDPREVVSPGDRVQVKVLEVNLEKKQISLTMKGAEPAAARPVRRERAPRAPKPRDSRDSRGPRGPLPKASAPRPNPNAKTIKPKEAFNNPFAALAGLKGGLKSNK